MFGYRLETFPRRPLRVGPIDAGPNDLFNLKNPACYVFPEENGCAPGGHFQSGDHDRAMAFASYRPFAFERSAIQTTADGVTVAALAAIALAALSALAMPLGGALDRAARALRVCARRAGGPLPTPSGHDSDDAPSAHCADDPPSVRRTDGPSSERRPDDTPQSDPHAAS